MDFKKYIFIVQVTRQLSIDILNNFADQGIEIELVTGAVESNYAPLDSRIILIVMIIQLVLKECLRGCYLLFIHFFTFCFVVKKMN
jgi:hypothetical protein